MQPTAFLVNVSRGALIDESAVIDALQENRIAGVALDVFEVEPLHVTSPLRTMKNVVLGSHNANNGLTAVESVHQNTLKNLYRHLS
jgi:D-3-phosphoglycerate dehydrogenase